MHGDIHLSNDQNQFICWRWAVARRAPVMEGLTRGVRRSRSWSPAPSAQLNMEMISVMFLWPKIFKLMAFLDGTVSNIEDNQTFLHGLLQEVAAVLRKVTSCVHRMMIITRLWRVSMRDGGWDATLMIVILVIQGMYYASLHLIIIFTLQNWLWRWRKQWRRSDSAW